MKMKSCVFRRLLMVCIMTAGCAGFSFGGGFMQGGGDTQGAGGTRPLGVSRATRVSKAAEAAETAEALEIAEVEEADYVPRRNPAAGRASSGVYALPASPLKPEAERLPTPVYAISGVRNQDIQEGASWEVVDIVVELPVKESFSRGLVEGADVSDWIINLPNGLEGRAHNVKKGATSIRIYVSGTPTVTARGEIKVRIPGTYLTGGADLQFISPTETESISAWEASQTAE
jgi:hypothetical protein